MMFCHNSLQVQAHAAPLFSMCVVNTRVLRVIQNSLNLEHREANQEAFRADVAPADSTGPTVKLSTADIADVDHENLILTPEASVASEAQWLSDQSCLSRSTTREFSRVITPLVAAWNQLDKKRGQ